MSTSASTDVDLPTLSLHDAFDADLWPVTELNGLPQIQSELDAGPSVGHASGIKRKTVDGPESSSKRTGSSIHRRLETPCCDPRMLNDQEMVSLLDEIPEPQPSTSGEQSGGSTADPPTFTIGIRSVVERENFRAKETIHKVTLHSVDKAGWKEKLNVLGSAIENSLSIATAGLHDEDLVRVYINQRELETPIVVHLRDKKDVSAATVMQCVEKTLQSKSTLQFNDSFELEIGTIRKVRGGRGVKITNIKEGKRLKKSIIRIQNKDLLCLPRAIVVAMAYKFNSKNKERIVNGKLRLQGIEAKKLCLAAGVSTNSLCDLGDVKKFEDALNVQIIVVGAQQLNRLIYKGDKERLAKLYLYFDQDHFDVITNMKAFYGTQYFCDVCLKGYNDREWHKCGTFCDLCYRRDCILSEPVECVDCFRTFRNKACFEKHKEQQSHATTGDGESLPSICQRFWACKHCHTLLEWQKRSPKEHKCGERFCKWCKVYHLEKHYCFIKPLEGKKPSCSYIFFDFECCQNTGEHIPNFAVAQKTCKTCINDDSINSNSVCQSCGLREEQFSGDDTDNDFCAWLFSRKHKNYTAVCHNLSGYDGIYLLKYLIHNSVTPQVTYSGSKIMYIHVVSLGIKIIDSLNHIPTSLANFPKTFGLTELAKGYFPHFFNTPENQNYIGPFPDPEFYGYDTMSTSNRTAFLEWYETQRGKVFDFRQEMYRYCKSDVDILRRSCLKYRELILGLTKLENSKTKFGIDPLDYVTVASLCFAIYRQLFLKPDQVARVPAEGLVARDQYSDVSIQWMEWLVHQSRNESKPLFIQHALNLGEKRIGNYRLDGWNGADKVVYEYHSCYFHGCPVCYKPTTDNSKVGQSMAKLYDVTMKKKAYLESLGFTYVCKWDHEFRQEIKDSEELRDFISTIDIQKRLDPRDAFFGGRTNASRLYHKVNGNERIQYVDFTSLYPFTNKRKEYPLGYPEIITDNFQPISQYFGFIKAKVLPPRGLYHPVLPYRTDKLLFPLCRTCADGSIAECRHTDEQRSIIGTWTSPELRLAVEKGYKVVKIYEVYHFSKTAVYDGQNQGLFSEYVNTFLKIKQQASGWPQWCKTEDDKQQYLTEYEKAEDITLDPSKIEKNPGLRSVAKLCLNSFWGKFGQRSNLGKTDFVSDVDEFFNHLNDREKTVTNFHLLTEDVVMLEWRHKSDAVETVASSNVYIAAFTTAHARIKLYEVLDLLNRNVLYYDTDSIVYIQHEGSVQPPLGDKLGDLTDELDGDFIETFVSGGPKNYCYRTNTGKEVCKVRGFSLNYKNSQLINFPKVEEMVKAFCTEVCRCDSGSQQSCPTHAVVTTVNPRKITRDKRKFKIVNKPESKDYRICYTKRVVQPNFDTLPFGF